MRAPAVLRQIAVAAAAALVAVAVSGYGRGVLDPQGGGAEAISDLWWVMFWVSLLPLAIVLAMLVRRRRRAGGRRAATLRRTLRFRPRRPQADPAWRDRPADPGAAAHRRHDDGHDRRRASPTRARAGDRRDRPPVLVGAALPEARHHAPRRGQALPHGQRAARARRARLELVVRSEDVIHSIWVPQVDGKIDMIPGRTNRLTIEARKPGVYEGHCAEFCGVRYALMRFQLVAHEPRRLRRLGRAGERSCCGGARRPASADLCGPLRSVPRPQGRVRESLVPRRVRSRPHPLRRQAQARAGLLPNTPEALARWLLDPQGVKPGNRMPYVGLDDDEVENLVEFLGELR